MAQAIEYGLRRRSELPAVLVPFFNFRANFFGIFQLSTGKFFGFSNFAAKTIRPYQLSGRKFLAGKNFEPCNRKAIGRNFSGFRKRSFWEFWGAKVRKSAKISGMKSFTQKKGSCFQGVPSGDFFKNVLYCHQTFPQKVCSRQRTFL